jgi:hypothetical protein
MTASYYTRSLCWLTLGLYYKKQNFLPLVLIKDCQLGNDIRNTVGSDSMTQVHQRVLL